MQNIMKCPVCSYETVVNHHYETILHVNDTGVMRVFKQYNFC
jgi:hypothetical protein